MSSKSIEVNKQPQIKICVFGGWGVGKSSLTLQFVGNVFSPEYDPTIEDAYTKHIQIPDIHGNITMQSPEVSLDILDTAGREEYVTVRDRHIITMDGCVLVYSVTNRESFEAIDQFMSQIVRVVDAEDGTIPIAIVANKLDLTDERVVSSLEGIQKAAAYKIPYIEASAKTAKNVANAFIDVARLVSEKRKIEGPKDKQKKSKPKARNSKTFECSKVVPMTRLFDQETEYQKPIPVIDIPPSTYLYDMSQLREENSFVDLLFKVVDSPEPISAHKYIVIARCDKMRLIIEEHEKSAKKLDPIPVQFKKSTFNVFLQYAYTSVVTIDAELEDEEVPLLVELAKEWSVPHLVALLDAQYPGKIRYQAGVGIPQDDLNSKFQQDMRRALIANDGDYNSYDVKFIIKDEPGKSIMAHKSILAQRSPYFRAMFTGWTKEKTAYEVEMSDFSHSVLLSAIEYCYTDDVKTITDEISVDLLIAANKLCLGRLKAKAAVYITKGMNVDNLAQMYRLATTTDSAALCEYCTFFVIRTLHKLENKKDFATVFSSDEIKRFQDIRSTWPNVESIEQYWIAKLEGKEPIEPESDKAPTNSTSKCAIM